MQQTNTAVSTLVKSRGAEEKLKRQGNKLVVQGPHGKFRNDLGNFYLFWFSFGFVLFGHLIGRDAIMSLQCMHIEATSSWHKDMP